jgi:hypothetical protein
VLAGKLSPALAAAGVVAVFLGSFLVTFLHLTTFAAAWWSALIPLQPKRNHPITAAARARPLHRSAQKRWRARLG